MKMTVIMKILVMTSCLEFLCHQMIVEIVIQVLLTHRLMDILLASLTHATHTDHHLRILFFENHCRTLFQGSLLKHLTLQMYIDRYCRVLC
jgi:hypothetical protein